ncbi:MAG: hypothetical protein ABSD70_20345, partial [Terracidiphilus sp.]
FVLFVRRRASSFPLFTAYIAERAVTTIALYFILNHLPFSAYRYTYWSLGAVDEVLQLFVLYELAVHIFCPTGVWARDVYKTFSGAACASTVGALLLTWLAHPTAPLPIQTFILRSNFFSAALMSQLFVGMVVLSATAGLPWKTHVARVAQGLGAYSLVCVAEDILVIYVDLGRHAHLYTEVSHFRILTYLGCEGFWILTLWQEAPAPRELPERMRTQIYALQRQVEGDLIRIRSWRRN